MNLRSYVKLPESVLNKQQRLTLERLVKPTKEYIVMTIRYDDECGNGHNSFAVTADLYESLAAYKDGDEQTAGGCLHEEVTLVFPEYVYLLKWHLCSSDDPLHYLENTRYWVEKGNLDYARSSAIAPDATFEELSDRDWLLNRLPSLMEEFKRDMEDLGFVY